MALPAPGTATRDGSCCCGDGGDCCPYGDPPDDLCLELSGSGWGDPSDGPGSETFPGAAYTLARSDGCVWVAVDVVIAHWSDPDSSDVYSWVAGGSPTNGVTATADGSGRFSVSGDGTAWFDGNTAAGAVGAIFEGVGDLPTPTDPTCLPQTFTLSYSWRNLLGVVIPTALTPTATLTAGPCSGPMAAAATDPPCRWRGPELTGPERSAAALDHRKKWFRCGKPGFSRLGLPVTDCRTCKSADMRCSKAGCTGYEPADVDGQTDV